jgi:hypothetical protein
MGLPARPRTWALRAGPQAERAQARSPEAARQLAEARLPAEAQRPQAAQPQEAVLPEARLQEAALVAPAEQLPARRPASEVACKHRQSRRQLRQG